MNKHRRRKKACLQALRRRLCRVLLPPFFHYETLSRAAIRKYDKTSGERELSFALNINKRAERASRFPRIVFVFVYVHL